MLSSKLRRLCPPACSWIKYRSFTILKDQMGPMIKNINEMEWDPSPSPTVFRKRLELLGEKESGRVTSVVKYEKNSSFKEHEHPDGEEILVLDGIFEDNHGKWPAGTYLLNPEGFTHAPGSKDGCTLFVKLKQFPGLDRQHVVVNTKDETNWAQYNPKAANPDAVLQCQLYGPSKHQNEKYIETMDMFRLKNGADLMLEDISSGLEMYILDGTFSLDGTEYTAGSWIKMNPDSIPDKRQVNVICLTEGSIYVKKNHLEESKL